MGIGSRRKPVGRHRRAGQRLRQHHDLHLHRPSRGIIVG